MKRILGILAFLFVLGAAPAFAVCPSTLQLKDNAGVTPNAVYVDDGSGNCQPQIVISPHEAGTAQTGQSQPAGGVGISGWLSGIYNRMVALVTAVGTPMQQTGGSVTANAGTNLNTSALATSANQTNASQKTQIVDGSGNVIGSTSNALNVNVNNSNANGPASAANSSPTVLPQLNHASTTALDTSLVAKASAGNLNSFNCTAITGGAAGYCIAYNGAGAPSTGALTGSLVLDFCYFDTTARGCSLSHLNGSINFSSGIVILATSAASPYTYTTGTDTAAIEADYN